MSLTEVATFTNVGFRRHARGFAEFEGDMSGKTVLVTGATGGLGLEAARSLSGMGAEVVIVGRDQAKLVAAAASITGASAVERADLSLLDEVRALADRLLETRPRIDVLVNNVGVLLPARQSTSEGLEATFATNLAGHFLLTNLLLPRLAAGSPGRVINVSSGGMYSERIKPDDLQFEERPYSGTAAYSSSKRAQVILTEMWARRFPKHEVVFHAMHPGWARTAGVAQSLPTFNRVMKPLLRTPAQGADTIVWLAAADEPTLTTGKFWFDRAEAPTHLIKGTRETAEDRARLWERLVEVTGTDVLVSVPAPYGASAFSQP